MTGAVVVEDDGCRYLDTGQQRWALTGKALPELRPGARVAVSGRLGLLPPGCTAPFALDVASVTTRYATARAFGAW